MAKMTLKVEVNDLHFQYQPRYPVMNVLCKFGDSSPNLWRLINADKPNLLEFWVKMTLKVKVNDPHFQ